GDPARADLLLCDLPAAVHFRRTIHGAAIALLDLFDAAGSPSRRRDFSAAERLRLLTAYGGGDRTAARRLYRALDRRTRIGHRLRKNFVMALRTYILPAAVPDRPGREPPRR
ncbi:MAG TPA: hypothetical protein VK348_08175, partial [Planctomycetota bacterium]|nr:hypothetical protein [Planctomycetota bacterium]